MRLETVNQAISEKKLWRAKEILQGHLRNPEVNLEMLQKYGEVLLEMNDLIEAGRMLFCAGARGERFSEAIEIFLSRNSRREPQRFLATLPSAIRRQRHLADFIASADFERFGWTEDQRARIVPLETLIDRKPKRESHRLASALAVSALLCLFTLIVVGLYTTVRFTMELFAL